MVPFDRPYIISLPLQLYLAPFSRYYHLFPKTEKSRVNLNIFSQDCGNSKDINESPKVKMGHMTLTTPPQGVVWQP